MGFAHTEHPVLRWEIKKTSEAILEIKSKIHLKVPNIKL